MIRTMMFHAPKSQRGNGPLRVRHSLVAKKWRRNRRRPESYARKAVKLGNFQPSPEWIILDLRPRLILGSSGAAHFIPVWLAMCLRDNVVMARKARQLDLSTFDSQLLDGLDFCGKVYDLFDQVSRAPDGIAKLRLRPTKTEKRLLEELIPIARYVQARYSAGRRIKVRWLNGSQPYDAILWSLGSLVEHHEAPRKVFVEVTTSVHENEHLARRLLHERGGSFGVKGISRDKKTGEIISKPYVHTNDELAIDLAGQIVKCLSKKSGKNYPPGTVLLVNCIANSLILDSEWSDAIERVAKVQAHMAFREVFLFETVMSHSATLYGNLRTGRAR